MTELNIINAMLKAIGQMPVSRADSSHPFAITAKETLDGVNEEVQSESGLWFNNPRGVSLSPDEAGLIRLPANVLSIDSVDRKRNLVQRGRVLYDMDNMTDIFTEREVVDIVFKIDVESLPTTVANFIKRRSVYEFFLDQDGEQKKLDKYERLMNDALMRFGSERIRNADNNMSDNPVYQKLMGRFTTPEWGVGGGDNKVWVKR